MVKFDSAYYNIPENENEMVETIISIEKDIGKEAVQDILKKIEAIFVLLPSAYLSIINSDYDLIAVSSSQKNKWFKTKLPKKIKCFFAYNKFKYRCGWCAAQRTLDTGKVTNSNDITTPEHIKTSNKQPDLVFSNTIAIPCGKIIDNKPSHCIEIIFIATKQKKKKTELKLIQYKFLEALVQSLQYRIVPHNLHRIIVVGGLYIASEKRHKSRLFIFDGIEPLDGTINRKITVEATEKNNSIWNEIIKNITLAKINTYINKFDTIKYKSEYTLEHIGVPKADIKLLKQGKVSRFHDCKKACVLIEGEPLEKLPHLLLMIDKSEIEDFIGPPEIEFLITFSIFCKYIMKTIRSQIDQKNILHEYEKIIELSSPPIKEAYLANLIISLTHNVCNEWRDNLEPSANALLQKIPKNIRQKEENKVIISSFKSSIESISKFFYTLGRWRHMRVKDLRPVNIVDLINNVLERFKSRFENINVKKEIPEDLKNCFVSADKDYLEEVISNIFTNAYDALSGFSNKQIIINLSIGRNEMLQLSIKDNGKGFSRLEREKIWAPGYTTKKEFGTGQGLPFVKYAIENAFKGKIDCYSIPEKRITAFILCLNKFKK